MSTVTQTNTTEDGQVPGLNPDGTTDYFLISDYNNDKNYFNAKICEVIKFLSTNPTDDFQIIYGGVVTDSGSSQIDISEGAAIGKDAAGNFRIVTIPASTNVALPSGWNNNRQIWVIGKHAMKLDAATRQHFNGTTYQYKLLDSYLGEGATDSLFVDADPGATVVKWGSFKMNGTTFTDQLDRSTNFTVVNGERGLIQGGAIFNSTSLPPTILAGTYEVDGVMVNLSANKTVSFSDVFGYSRQNLDTYGWYLECLDKYGYANVIWYGEGAVASATGNITSITESPSGTYTLTKSTGTVGAYTSKTIVITDGATTIYSGKITGGNGSTTMTFLANAGLTFPITGTWTVYGRINTLHGTGSATEITTDANIALYTPSLGENGWSAGIAAWSDSKQGFYLSLLGLTGYRVIGVFNVGAAGVSTDIKTYLTCRNKNDNSFMLQNHAGYGGGSFTMIPYYSILQFAKGCDYILNWNDSSVGDKCTIKRGGAFSIYIIQGDTSRSGFGSSINTTQGTTAISSIAENDKFISFSSPPTYNVTGSRSASVNKDDIIRPHSDSTGTSYSVANHRFGGTLTL